MIEINGAHGEGGGQILRTSLTLSALTGIPLHIHHIRAQRRQPGLRPQHLAAVRAIAKLTDADLTGAMLDSHELTLVPKKLRSGRFRFEIPTAGALSLVLQTVFLPLSLAAGTSELTLTGGTHVPWSPIFHYVKYHWLALLKACGFRAAITLHVAGFYPQGGGEAGVKILPPKGLCPLELLSRGELTHIRGFSGVANLGDEISQRQKHRALQRLYPLCRDAKIKTLNLPSPGKGTFIQLTAHFSNGAQACYTALGARGKPAEQVADESVDQLLAFLKSDGTVDQYVADQLLLPLSLIKGSSRFRTNQISPHLLTNAYVIEQFLPAEIVIDGSLNQPGWVSISGINGL
jgi:RNA 3'-terminal phosphate cyclase (ATP)